MQLTSHDAVGEYHDVNVRWKLTDSEEHTGDDAADDAYDTTSELVDERARHRSYKQQLMYSVNLENNKIKQASLKRSARIKQTLAF